MAPWTRALAALAVAAPVAGTNPHERLGEYRPVSSVIEYAHIAFDVKGITNYVDRSHQYDFGAAKAIWEGGRHSCLNTTAPRSLKSLVSLATAASQLRGEAYFDSFTNGTGPSAELGAVPGTGRLSMPLDFWDDFISSALDGTGRFATKSTVSRMVAVKKGILGAIAMYVSHLLETSITLASSGRTGDADGAPHAWDQAWALYYGACGGGCLEECVTQGWCRYSAWEATKKRDGDHALSGPPGQWQRVDGAIFGSEVVMRYFTEGQRASRTATLDVPTMVRARDNIYRIFALTAIRDSLRYSYAVNRGNGLKWPALNELLHMQAYAYFLSAAGWIEQASPGTAADVLQLLDFQQETGQMPISLHCDVKAKLIATYAPLGLDCQNVGQDWAIPEDFSCEAHPPTWQTLGSGTVCRLDDQDTTFNGDNSVLYGDRASLESCQASCIAEPSCLGVEYHDSATPQCELWTRPIGHHKSVPGYACTLLRRTLVAATCPTRSVVPDGLRGYSPDTDTATGAKLMCAQQRRLMMV